MKRSASSGGKDGRHSAAHSLAVGVLTVLCFGSAGAAQDDPDRAETRLEEIIVTGSLISDPNRVSPSPIVIMSWRPEAERHRDAGSGAQPAAAVRARRERQATEGRARADMPR